MPVRDSIALLRDLDPVAAPPAPRRATRRRRSGRWPALAAATTAALALGLAATSDHRRAPGLAAAAHATLTAPDRILHLRLRSQFQLPRDEPSTTELWTRAGGRQLRLVYDDGEHEFVRDTDNRYAASYVRHRNLVMVYDQPEMWEIHPAEELNFAGPDGVRRLAHELPALLARARDGDPAVRRRSDAELDGHAVARVELRTTQRAAVRAPAAGELPVLEPVVIRTVVWLDLDTHLPRRIERFVADRRESITDVVLAERLEIDDASRRLLELPRHPGATRVVGGRG